MEYFEILGIEETQDKTLIQKAYHEKLSLANPEDNPEGFKRLRNAYERALEYAQQEQKKQQVKDAVDILLDKFEAAYRNIDRRRNPDVWSELLADELFCELDLEEAAKWRFFTWLADHWRLPIEIWRLLDKKFEIVTHVSEFREHLPEGFVTYMEDKLSTEGEASDFPYDKFEVQEGIVADYDAFIEGYGDLSRLVETAGQEEHKEESLKEAEQKIRYLESLGISHPWYLLEKARYLVLAGNRKQAEEIARRLLETQKQSQEIYLGCARLFMSIGLEEEAAPMFEELHKQENLSTGASYHVSLNLAMLHEKAGRYEEARELCLDADDIYSSEETTSLLKRVNDALIDKWTNTVETLTQKNALRLAWCFIQNERYKEGLDYLNANELIRQDTYHCHRARAILSLNAGDYEEAVSQCESWLHKLEEEALTQDASQLPEDDEPLNEEQRKEYQAHALVVEARTYQAMGRNSSQEEAAALYRKAEEAFTKAQELCGDNVGIIMDRMLLARERKEYEQMANLCEHLKELDENFYWAYFYAQEAYEGLRRAQEVVDNFYAAKRLYAGHADIYERTAEVFIDFGQYTDATNILNQAKEANVSSPKLKVQELTVMRALIQDSESARKTNDYALSLIAELEEAKADEQLIGQAYQVLVSIQTSQEADAFRCEEKILGWARRAVELYDTVNARYFLGRELYWGKQYEEAIEQFKVCEEREMTFCWLYYFMGRSYEELDKPDDAVLYFEKAAREEPEETDFAWRAAWIYRNKFADTRQKEYYDRALKYMAIQLERQEATDLDYWQLSYLHNANMEYELALEESEKALALNKRAQNWVRKAQTLELLQRPEEAVKMYEKGLLANLKNGRDYEYVYDRMESYFARKGEYEKGVKWFRWWMPKLKTSRQRDLNLVHIRYLYIWMKDYAKAMEVIEEQYGSTSLTQYSSNDWEEEGERIHAILGLYQEYLPPIELQERVQEALALMEGEGASRLKDSAMGRYTAYEEIACTWSWYLMDDKKGMFYYNKAYEVLLDVEGDADHDRCKTVLKRLLACSSRLGDSLLVQHYGELYQEEFAREYARCGELGMTVMQMHEASFYNRRHVMYQLFCCAYYMGDYEKARYYIKEMEASRWCAFCSRTDCIEMWECKGYMALINQDYEQAKRCFEHAVACSDGGNDDAEYELRRIQSNFHGK